MLARLRALSLRGIDYPLLLTVAVLLVLGLVMVYSASFGLNMAEEGRPTTTFLVRQAEWAAIGALALLVMALIDYQTWRRWSIPIMAAALVILIVLLFVRGGGDAQGEQPTAQRWLLGNSVQPSEIVKLAVIIYVADWLASKGEKIRQLTYGMVPFAILLGVITGLIVLQPNFSTALIIVCTAVAMFFVAGADIRQLLIGGLVGGASLGGLVRMSGYAWNRVTTFINDPLRDPLGHGYQTAQSVYALQAGGFFGVGLGNSAQKMGALYAAHTDAIFAIIGEELGLIGTMFIIALYAIVAYRGLRIAMRCSDPFGALLATGVTSWLMFQALLHMGVVTATVPFTGITLPFLSFGGSSLVASLAGVGLLLSVSRGVQAGRVR
ncbi:MAG TPA: putative lipid II flippase FtsW [Anaerolineae bacterium]|nr:putative lipid II flippase FtsW [Anaerolineae bacterium]HPL26987.1 putative lipid II flippase FtsW [Anaerolineae bacterium]